MKKLKNILFVAMLFISLIFNGLLCYYIHETEKPTPLLQGFIMICTIPLFTAKNPPK